jgi:hypothetical protein
MITLGIGKIDNAYYQIKHFVFRKLQNHKIATNPQRRQSKENDILPYVMPSFSLNYNIHNSNRETSAKK